MKILIEEEEGIKLWYYFYNFSLKNINISYFLHTNIFIFFLQVKSKLRFIMINGMQREQIAKNWITCTPQLPALFSSRLGWSARHEPHQKKNKIFKLRLHTTYFASLCIHGCPPKSISSNRSVLQLTKTAE